MKLTAMTTMVLMTGSAVYGQSMTAQTGQRLTLCLDGDAAGLGTVLRAQAPGSQMFATIGITLKWERAAQDCPAEAIRISLNRNTPAALKPGALAYALPYEGTHIWVFYDRISRQWQPDMVPIVLAHVMVHEITHILQGINRHSSQGIMKAHWDEKDYFHMRSKPLEFAPEDVDLIYRGLSARAGGSMLAMNAKPVLAGQ